MYDRPRRFRRLVDPLAAHLLAVLLYPFVLWAYREERKAGQR